MNNAFKSIMKGLLDILSKEGFLKGIEEKGVLVRLTRAFLDALSGDHGSEKNITGALSPESDLPLFQHAAEFYLDGVRLINEEIENAINETEGFNSRLKSLAVFLCRDSHGLNEQAVLESLWSLFFPEGCSILRDKKAAEEALRKKRVVRITAPNPAPLIDPVSEILFTSNVLITVPPEGISMESTPLNSAARDRLSQIIKEEQLYWYDHPMEIGTDKENSEFLYGLKGFKEAVTFEKERGNTAYETKPVLLMSVSVTHKGLHDIAASYLEGLLCKTDYPDNLDLYLFTEKDTQDMVRDVLAPSAKEFLNRNGSDLSMIFGVDGEYGRHYSFLKAVALFWNILINERVSATFKIDLDQVFPQERLVHETGKSAFEHLKSSLWGASGIDSKGAPVELGMIAGALVNKDDIKKGLFTPDVKYPAQGIGPDEMIFFSKLPQALSTRAEMMARYNKDSSINGIDECIERIHVTGGTTGILVDCLKRHRPFTPSFIGRAEDQAYIISTLFNRHERLAYLHEDGLIMRHDKKAFAKEGDMRTQISKLTGDFIRILYFSNLSRLISGGSERVKGLLDPYTGCFISSIPITVVYLRLALKALSLAREGKIKWADELIASGAKRIPAAIGFCSRGLKGQYEREQKAWRLYYDTMSALGDSICAGNPSGLEMRKRARDIVSRCLVKKRGLNR